MRRQRSSRRGSCGRPSARSISCITTSGWLSRSSSVKPRRTYDASREPRSRRRSMRCCVLAAVVLRRRTRGRTWCPSQQVGAAERPPVVVAERRPAARPGRRSRGGTDWSTVSPADSDAWSRRPRQAARSVRDPGPPRTPGRRPSGRGRGRPSARAESTRITQVEVAEVPGARSRISSALSTGSPCRRGAARGVAPAASRSARAGAARSHHPSTAAKTGTSQAASGAANPRSRAPVRWVNTAPSGSTSSQARQLAPELASSPRPAVLGAGTARG